VLRAMGLTSDEASSALRLTLGDSTTEDDIEKVVALFPQIVEKARAAGTA
jgi:cysteine desulfurase